MGVEVELAVLAGAIGLLAAIAVMCVAVDGISMRVQTAAPAAVAILSGLAIAHSTRRLTVRIERLQGWVALMAGEAEVIRREVASHLTSCCSLPGCFPIARPLRWMTSPPA
ncbi:MAG: hypothetical protein R3D05_01530 [Dongiaceae bacterium]